MAGEAQNWLTRMTEAAGNESFHGAFVYERTGSFTTHEIWRQVDDETTTERLVQTDGEYQEWLRRNGKLICSTSGGPVIASQEASQTIRQPELLEEWYELQVLGSTRVASRPVTVVAVRPRDSHRYAYEFYLDSDTGLLLKSLMVNERQALLERFQFATFELDPAASGEFAAGDACLELAATEAESMVPDNQWQPTWLPPGFTEGQQAQLLNEGDGQIVSQVYTDGLARFTLFIESLSDEHQAEDLRAQLGPTVAVSRKLNLAEGPFLATVVGEIPPSTAERIVGSLVPEQGVQAP
ncbi:MucB/RseB C-terminal domain-containing protein [Pseudomonas profundi]|uniref:MucB/RseB C-terminal domain-containing protein n=1 Tax=Pseudomonas TaxID=286 RepID=UPI00168147FA|nr:MucB/RseB C-terminal domain-containing protein [Pseudomonas profundi]